MICNSLSLSNLVLSISLFGIMLKQLVDTSKFQRISELDNKIFSIWMYSCKLSFHILYQSASIISIFPPFGSDIESEISSESNKSSPQLSCSIDTIFLPARSPIQSPPRFSYQAGIQSMVWSNYPVGVPYIIFNLVCHIIMHTMLRQLTKPLALSCHLCVEIIWWLKLRYNVLSVIT